MESILIATFRHLQITFSGVFIAALVGIGTGILITKHRRLAEAVMSATDLIQTVPSLALLAILMMFFGLGDLTVIIALFLYSLLPIVRNTYVGLKGIDSGLVEAGVGMGMTRFQLLWKVKLPIALPVILSGIRVALVTALGIATIGVLIGAGGLGTFVYRGVQMADVNLILTGAVPLSILAIGTDLFLEATSGRMLRSKRRTVK
jgi:osmoprotectant transport system permease protein